MGAWGTGPFENDGSLGPLSDLEHGEAGQLAGSFQVVQDNPDYLEIHEGQAAIAAAELVAAAFGSPAEGLPERAARIVALRSSAIRDLPGIVPAARRAIARILSDGSELAESWDEGESGPAWRASIARLDARLSEVDDA